jgi:hypothetical protein
VNPLKVLRQEVKMQDINNLIHKWKYHEVWIPYIGKETELHKRKLLGQRLLCVTVGRDEENIKKYMQKREV